MTGVEIVLYGGPSDGDVFNVARTPVTIEIAKPIEITAFHKPTDDEVLVHRYRYERTPRTDPEDRPVYAYVGQVR